MHQRRLLITTSILFLVGVNIFLWGTRLRSPSVLSVSFLDVGQGDAIYIRTPNGNDVLIDAGANRSVLRSLGKVMPFFDRHVDISIATHPDMDHIGGFVPFLSSYSTSVVLDSGNKKDGSVVEEFAATLEQKNIPIIRAQRGMNILLDAESDIWLRILFPGSDVSEWDANDASIVAVLSYGDTSFLLTGDAPAETEYFLLEQNPELRDMSVLKLGHHGSGTSSAFRFLEITSPEISIVSAGKNNRYGHPSKETVEKLNLLSLPFRSTAEEGTITITSDGTRIY